MAHVRSTPQGRPPARDLSQWPWAEAGGGGSRGSPAEKNLPPSAHPPHRDAQRVEELCAKNHQLREQQKALKENLRALENRWGRT